MKVYKLGKGRSCFSVFNYFIKLIFSRNLRNITPLLSGFNLGPLLSENEIAYYPRIVFQKKMFGVYAEVCERIKDARPLSNEHELFYCKLKRIVPSAHLKYESVSWHTLLSPSILSEIKRKTSVYQYIETVLEHVQYPNTGMHGDLNPNNVLIDSKSNFWIVDWESYSEVGSVVWDLYWFYTNWKRSTSVPGQDIFSIYHQINASNIKTQELLLMYAILKIRMDLRRHHRDIETVLDHFFKRVMAIIEIHQPSTDQSD